MLVYDKLEIRNSLKPEQVFNLFQEFGGNPTYQGGCIVSDTICHHHPGEGSHKLFYYLNTKLCKCYTGGCKEHVFDLFELVIKVMKIQHNLNYDLNDAIRWVAQYFGIIGKEEDIPNQDLEDWKILEKYSRVQEIQPVVPNIVLKEYDDKILENFNYKLKLTPWLKEGISQQVLDNAEIGYYPGDAQITIPHFDKNGRFIGLRGRTMVAEDAERYGKYRPIKVGNVLYNHPLGLNLYNFNNSRQVIPRAKKAVVFEGEKSVLLYQTYFGFDRDISVAVCGSSLSSYQAQLLIDGGAQEIIIAFDRQFQNVGDDEYYHLVNNLKKIQEKYKNYVQISYILDKNKITDYKSAPIDHGPDKFLKLFKERINT